MDYYNLSTEVLDLPAEEATGPDYLSRLDEILLISAGFKRGVTGETLFRKDHDGQLWAAALVPGRTLIAWYTVRESGGLTNYNGVGYAPMLREDFIRRFR